MTINLKNVPTPCYVAYEEKLKENLAKIDEIQKRTGCKVLLALKAFAMFSVFNLYKGKIVGTCVSSLNEAKLGKEKFGGEVHLYSAAYREDEIDQLVRYSDKIIFNSFSQWNKFREKVKKSNNNIDCGIRVNPEYSKVKIELYDPCCKGSRLGVTLAEFHEKELEGINGLHFHNHCGNNSDVLEETLKVVGEKFGDIIKKMKWVNFGGGQSITEPGYDIDRLCNNISAFKKEYGVEVILEPGEAFAYDAGVLVTSVLDIMHNDIDIAILDCSAVAHMPDVVEMPYKPIITGASKEKEFPYVYRLAGPTCLAGDIIGEYSFPQPLKLGDKIVLEDMLQYTMVKNNTFNGINLPSIAIHSEEKGLNVIKTFTYEDYKSRLS
ncbi:MAG: carboxynorspermidine decarboxylase [Nitrospinae bacterium]|nr:carboxynorspermidine decarboxylase [Nitrospinota bacterium]